MAVIREKVARVNKNPSVIIYTLEFFLLENCISRSTEGSEVKTGMAVLKNLLKFNI